MKRAISFVMAFILGLGLCSCGANVAQQTMPTIHENVKHTVVLTEENFDQYFDLSVRTEYDGLEYSGSKVKATATVYIDLTPKFTGTWNSIKADLVWTVHIGASELMRDTWTFGNNAESRLTFDLPPDCNDTEVGSANFNGMYETVLMDINDVRLTLVEDSLYISYVHAENVSGSITVE